MYEVNPPAVFYDNRFAGKACNLLFITIETNLYEKPYIRKKEDQAGKL